MGAQTKATQAVNGRFVRCEELQTHGKTSWTSLIKDAKFRANGETAPAIAPLEKQMMQFWEAEEPGHDANGEGTLRSNSR